MSKIDLDHVHYPIISGGGSLSIFLSISWEDSRLVCAPSVKQVRPPATQAKLRADKLLFPILKQAAKTPTKASPAPTVSMGFKSRALVRYTPLPLAKTAPSSPSVTIASASYFSKNATAYFRLTPLYRPRPSLLLRLR